MLQTLVLASVASAMVIQPPALPLGLKLRSGAGAGVQNFCFPPYSTATVRIPAGGNMGPGNSSVMMTEQFWTAPDALRFKKGRSVVTKHMQRGEGGSCVRAKGGAGELLWFVARTSLAPSDPFCRLPTPGQASVCRRGAAGVFRLLENPT